MIHCVTTCLEGTALPVRFVGPGGAGCHFMRGNYQLGGTSDFRRALSDVVFG